MICLGHGLLSYEYNELLTLEQIPKLEFLLSKLASYGINIEDLIAIKAWLFLRGSKNILLLNNIVFMVCFYIYHIYKDDFTNAFNDVRKAVTYLVVLMGTYSAVELLWLKLKLPIAKGFLEFVNPYLYDIVIVHGWWPPLLWPNQLRSICREPSFFGIIAVMCLPLVWSLVVEKKYKKIGLFVVFYYTFMIAATNARTAIVLTLGELFLLCLFNLFVMSKDYFRHSCIVVLVSVLAFGVNLININSFLHKNDVQTQSINSYVKSNVTSVADTTSRSNNARFASLVANINTI